MKQYQEVIFLQEPFRRNMEMVIRECLTCICATEIMKNMNLWDS